MKLLSPVGNIECLKSAILGGADEVYLGINEFNARNNIDGFNLENLKEAVDYSHLFGVKVLLAVNILFSDEELEKALNVVITAYNLGVDAFIVQDLGLAYLLNKHYPEITLHASTQMGIHNLEGVKQIEKYGFTRVVLSRETPLDEIKRIRENSNIEIEYFVHGALCVSFSGNCYLSSYLNNASGNRGRCKQLCRLPYSLLKDGKTLKKGYLLSAKDFNMLNRLSDLKKAGVDVLKIEGRARRPYYVYTATKEYRRALDGKKANETDLELAFNRGFTEGYFGGNGQIISELQNHIGVSVGKVLSVKDGKKFNEIVISSTRPLYPKSTFKLFVNGKECNTLTAYDLKEIKPNEYKITTTQKVIKGSQVRLISDYQKETEISNLQLKRAIDVSINFTENEPIKAEFIIDGNKYVEMGAVAIKAENRPLTAEEIERNFQKCDFAKANVNIEKLDGVFLPKSELNNFRRKTFEKVYEVLTKVDRQPLEEQKINFSGKAISFDDFEYVYDKNSTLTAKNIVYAPDTYNEEDVIYLLKRCRAEGKELYLDTPVFALKTDVERLKDIVDRTGVKVVANNYYALSLGADVIGAGLNVYNNISASAHGKPIITAEGNTAKRIDMPYMTLRFCPIKSHLGGDCKNCKYANGLELKMDSGKRLKIRRKKLSDCTFYLTDAEK